MIEGRTRGAEDGTDTDVVVLGGSFSGASTAILLRRWIPGCRVTVVETREAFDRKVGEATVEISATFLHRVLGMYDELSREHLPKHGLRYWIADRPDRRLEEMVELGPTGPPSLPTFQLDRSRLDETLLGTARREGAEVLRPARVRDVEPGDPISVVTVETGGERRTLRARWVVDATGRQSLLGRRLGLQERTESHPTAALWARFRGVADLDGPQILGNDPRRPRLPAILAARRLATNHFCGYGWWCWTIPLAGGETSVGVVWDKRLVSLDGEGSLRESFLAFVRSRAGLGELLRDAEIVDDDFKSLRHLPYRSTAYAGPGWALVGDAAAFLDPFYSPGLDHCSISVFATVRLLEAILRDGVDASEVERRIAYHNRIFVRSYGRWLQALYEDKYELMGDAQLMAAATFFETGAYYQGPVATVYRDLEMMGMPLFGEEIPQVEAAYRFLRFVRRRLVRIARFRRERGTYGRGSVGWRDLRKYSLGFGGFRLMAVGLGYWLRAEARTALERLRPGPRSVSEEAAA